MYREYDQPCGDCSITTAVPCSTATTDGESKTKTRVTASPSHHRGRAFTLTTPTSLSYYHTAVCTCYDTPPIRLCYAENCTSLNGYQPRATYLRTQAFHTINAIPALPMKSKSGQENKNQTNPIVQVNTNFLTGRKWDERR